MLSKLSALHFSPKPKETIDFMLHSGMAPVYRDYGLNATEIYNAIERGTSQLARLSTQLTDRIRSSAGHLQIFNSLKHASYTEDGILLFVSSGLNPKKFLQHHKDEYWWGGIDFNDITHAKGGYCRLIRGYDPLHHGHRETPFTLSLDSGSHFEQLHAVCINRYGDVLHRISL